MTNSSLKIGDALLILVWTALVSLAITGCSLFSKDASQQQKLNDANKLAYAAASIGTQEALVQNPSWRPRFLEVEAQLDQFVSSKTVTGALLRDIIASLPVRELRSERAMILIREITVLYDATAGTLINVEQQPYVLAIASGLRDGMRIALGN